MTPEQLQGLLKQEENIDLEFKEKVDLKTSYGKAKLIKEILALVNTSGSPAYLIIGVEDKTKNLVDIGDIKEETLQQIIEDNCKPAIRFSFEIVVIEDVTIGVITIPHSPRKPHTLRKKFGFSDLNGKQYELSDKQVFIRRGSVIYEASVEEIIEMAQEGEDYNGLFLDELQDIRSALGVIAEHSYNWLGSNRNKVTVENINLHPIANGLSLIANALWPTFPNRIVQHSSLGALIGFVVGGLVTYQIVIEPIGGALIGLLLGVILSGLGIIKFGPIRLVIISILVGVFVAYEMLNSSLRISSNIGSFFSNVQPASGFIVGSVLGGLGGFTISLALKLAGFLGNLYQHWNSRVRIIESPYKRK